LVDVLTDSMVPPAGGLVKIAVLKDQDKRIIKGLQI